MRHFKLILSLSLLFLLSSCACGFKYSKITKGIYISIEELQKNIKSDTPHKIKNVGKIYTYKNYIFIHEQNIGLHVIDNSDIKKPENISFIKIPFSTDIAIKDDILYADSFNDLLAIDIKDIKNIKLKSSNKNVFKTNMDLDKREIYIGFEESNEYVPVLCGSPIGNFGSINRLKPSVNLSSSSSNIGISGSLARFSIIENFLYVLSNDYFSIYSINESKNLNLENTINNNENVRNLETIFPYEDKLFLGSQTGMYIFDNKNKKNPSFLSKYEHIKSCDPIVVENNRAYITLRDGNSCQNGKNELDILDISNDQVKEINKINMINPSGLAVKKGIVYVCDNNAVKIYDLNDPINLKTFKQLPIKEPMDIILNNNEQVIVIAKDGLHQFDLSYLNNAEISEVSFIKAEPNEELYKMMKIGNKSYYSWYKDYL